MDMAVMSSASSSIRSSMHTWAPSKSAQCHYIISLYCTTKQNKLNVCSTRLVSVWVFSGRCTPRRARVARLRTRRAGRCALLAAGMCTGERCSWTRLSLADIFDKVKQSRFFRTNSFDPKSGSGRTENAKLHVLCVSFCDGGSHLGRGALR